MASGTGSSCGSAPPWPPRPRSRAGSSADDPPTATGSPTPGRTPTPPRPADGKRLHKLEQDPGTAWAVRRIFAEYLAGRGLFAIAEGLTRDRVPSPSQHDAARNPHRTGQGWAKAAVRAILRNPRYTGRQVWNKQRKDEILLDVNDVARGYETRLRWNDTGQWVWSETLAQEPPGLRRGLRGRAGHHGRRRARPAQQPRGTRADHAPLHPARAALLRLLRTPDARPVQQPRTLLPVPLPEGIRPRQPRPPPRQRLPPRGRHPARHRQMARRPLRAAPAHPDHPRASGPGPSSRARARRDQRGHPRHHRRLRRPPRPLPGRSRRRSRPTRRPSPNGPARSKPNGPQRSPATPARSAARPAAGSLKTTSAPSSSASATCVPSSAPLIPP